MAVDQPTDASQPTAGRSGRTYLVIVPGVWLAVMLALAVLAMLSLHDGAASLSSLYLDLARLVASLPVVALVSILTVAIAYHHELADFLGRAEEARTPWGSVKSAPPFGHTQASRNSPGVPAADDKVVTATVADETPTQPSPQQVTAVALSTTPNATERLLQDDLLQAQRLRVFWFFRYLVVALPPEALEVVRWFNRFSYPTTAGPTQNVNVDLTTYDATWKHLSAQQRQTIIDALFQNGLLASPEKGKTMVTWNGNRLVAFADATWNPITDYPGDYEPRKCDCCSAIIYRHLGQLPEHNRFLPEGIPTFDKCECGGRFVAPASNS